jgi:hypothetical protein
MCQLVTLSSPLHVHAHARTICFATGFLQNREPEHLYCCLLILNFIHVLYSTLRYFSFFLIHSVFVTSPPPPLAVCDRLVSLLVKPAVVVLPLSLYSCRVCACSVRSLDKGRCVDEFRGGGEGLNVLSPNLLIGFRRCCQVLFSLPKIASLNKVLIQVIKDNCNYPTVSLMLKRILCAACLTEYKNMF